MIAIGIIAAVFVAASGFFAWLSLARIWPRLKLMETETASIAVELLQFWATAVGALGLSLTLATSVYTFSADNQQKERQRQLELDKAAEAQFSEAIRLLEQPSVVSYQGGLLIISSLADRQPDRFAAPSRLVVRTAIQDLERRLAEQETVEPETLDEEMRLRFDQLLKGYVSLHPLARLPGKPADDVTLSASHPRVDLRMLNVRKLDGAGLSGSSVSLRLAVIPEAKLFGAHLARSDFFNAEVPQGDFFRARLAHANFELATLTGANFGGADLRHANFQGANLRGALLIGARMKCAQLAGADLSGARLDIATIAHAQFYVTTTLPADLDRAAIEEFRVRQKIRTDCPKQP